MPRRQYKKRKYNSDSIYGSLETTKLINHVMRDGKKSVAENIVYTAYKLIEEKELNPLDVLRKAISNVAPNYEVRPKRVGGASYLVPAETRTVRRLFLALKWVLDAANKRSSKEYKSAERKLFAELMDASVGQGEAVAKRKQVEKLAEANKAFSHFRW